MTFSFVSLLKHGGSPTTRDFNQLLQFLYGSRRFNCIIHLFTQIDSSQIEGDFHTLKLYVNALINHQRCDEALNLLKSQIGRRLNFHHSRIFEAWIQGLCKDKNDPDKGLFVLREYLRIDGAFPSSFTFCSLIHSFSSQGKMDKVFKVLELMIDEKCKYPIDNFVCSSVICGFVRIGKPELGIQFFDNAMNSGALKPNHYTCTALMSAYIRLGRFEDVLAIYKGMPDKDLVPDSVTYCTLIDGYCRAGMISEAFEIFDDFRRASNSSAACYKYIIQSLCLNGMVDMAIKVFKELVVTGVSIDRIIQLMLINKTFNVKGADGVLDLIHQIENFGGESFSSMCNDIIHMLCERGSFDAVLDVFTVMRRNKFAIISKIYYGMMKALLFDGKILMFLVTLTLFLKQYGMSIPRVNNILIHYLSLKNVSKMLSFIASLKEKSVDVKLPVNIVKMLIKDRGALDSYKLIMSTEYDGLLSKCIVNYSMLIDGLCKEGHVDKALDLCNFAQKKGFSINVVMYSSVINGLCRQGCIVEALRLLDSLERIDIVPSEITYGTVIDALSQELHLMDAQKLFETMLHKNVKPNTHMYNSLIHGHCSLGQLQEALNLLLDLRVKGLKPDEFTISAVIYGYYVKGDMEGSLEFFSDFKRKGIFPDFLGFMHLLRGLWAKGRMEESQGILRDMLQSQSVMDLLKRIDSDIESESVQNFLVHLCEQGSIKDAIAILDEIGLIFFPHRRRPKTNEMYFKQNEITEYKSLRCRHLTKLPLQEVPHSSIHLDNEISQPLDFDSYYQIAASLYSKGETNEANRLIKNSLSFLELN